MGVFKFNKSKEEIAEINLKLLFNLTKFYNTKFTEYTRSYKGRISVPTKDKNLIAKHYFSVKEYIKSKPLWIAILTCNSVMENEIYNYIETMIKNWNEIKVIINCTKMVLPVSNIIFSPKMYKYYFKFVDNEEKKKEINRHLSIKTNNEFYTLNPNIAVDISTLINLQVLNSDLTYHEILDIFSGEFHPEFKIKVLNMKIEEINQETLEKMFI